MPPAAPETGKVTALERVPHAVAVPLLLALCAILAITSLLGDSITFDETSHLTGGFSYLRTGDFRMQPEHPPLPNMWAALPLLLMENHWPGPETPGWRQGNYWVFGRTWLCERADGEHLLRAARCMRVVWLLVTCVLIYAVARRLFGPPAGLLALVLSVLSPTLLAHGRLVTNDLPAAMGVTLALLTQARLWQRVTWGRLGLAALAAAILPLVKFSWVLALPPLLLTVLVAIVRRDSPTLELWKVSPGGESAPGRLASRTRRAVVLGALTVLLGLTSWAAIWCCYAWRYSAFRGADRDAAMFVVMPDRGQAVPTTHEQAWETVLHDADGRPLSGLVPSFVRFGRRHQLLPEAYLYGLALATKFTAGQRPAYLNGEVYLGGRAAYFPTAFAIKTPIPTLLLLLMGIAALVARRTPRARDPALLAGLLAFGALYGVASVTLDFNIGHRHLVPLYPVVFVLAGAAAAWLSSRVVQGALVLAVAWAVFAAVRIHPHYLCYFNEFVGGPANGHLYLAASNVDWGQDLKRLARYANDRPGETIKLAYCGSADPRRYGFRCEPLPSFLPVGEPGELSAGTYVISVNHLVGLYEPSASAEAWADPNHRAFYRRLQQRLARPPRDGMSPRQQAARRAALQVYRRLRWGRLLSNLRRRAPDERIGWSLFVYRLTDADIDRLTQL